MYSDTDEGIAGLPAAGEYVDHDLPRRPLRDIHVSGLPADQPEFRVVQF